jgi:hypothetical protein
MSADDKALNRLLAEALTPADRPADAAFVARVDRAVVADAIYRRQRNMLWRRFGGETLAIGAVGASLAVLARIPDLRALLAQASDIALPALLALPLLLLWILVVRTRPAFA